MSNTESVLEKRADLAERLSAHRTIGGIPDAEVQWLVAHGQLRQYAAGETVATPSSPVEGMFVLLAGRISIHLVRGTTRHKVAEWRGGDVTGLLPYSRLGAPPGDTVVEEVTEALFVRREDLPAMTRECQELTSILVHVMLDRARFFNSTLLHDEKLKSLGKLAAGLAHELNNPAAAIVRSGKMLRQNLEAVTSAARALGAADPTTAELELATELSAQCLATPVQHIRSPLEEAEREAALADWLAARGLDGDIAEVVAQSPVSVDVLERASRAVRPAVLDAVLRSVAAECGVRKLATEIEQAAGRISGLVAAVRGFTRMDAATAPQPLDLPEGLTETIAVLGGKARGKSIRLELRVEENLPKVRGVGAELNQVWANLIDNALDAVPSGGHVEIEASRRGDSVVVRVVDDGPGIPDDIRDRIFDPFFTTKDVGQGTGLGLDITRRLVARHDGDIEVSSRPGRTEFVVSLPVAAVEGGEAGA